jgi:drug/metabolite transporter (DMT)-like permease
MGYFFYNEVPDASVVIGMLLIVLSGIYIVYREQQKKKNIVSESILKNTR